jgi:catechol 2,3-dioxygenase-like lactoylglutathione lyase family enzyme
MALDHVALTVSDRDRSATFYAEHFGLTKRVHDDEHLLIIGDEQGSLLALSTSVPPAAAGLSRTSPFGFRLTDREAVLAARERFRAAGVTELEWQEHGSARVQVADPTATASRSTRSRTAPGSARAPPAPSRTGSRRRRRALDLD